MLLGSTAQQTSYIRCGDVTVGTPIGLRRVAPAAAAGRATFSWQRTLAAVTASAGRVRRPSTQPAPALDERTLQPQGVQRRQAPARCHAGRRGAGRAAGPGRARAAARRRGAVAAPRRAARSPRRPSAIAWRAARARP